MRTVQRGYQVQCQPGHVSDGVARNALALKRGKAVAFNLDEASLASLREALPLWPIDDIYGATVTSLPCNWNPGAVDLLVMGIRKDVGETLELCRFLAFCNDYSADFRREAAVPFYPWDRRWNQVHKSDAPLVVLIPAGKEDIAGAAIEAGAHCCLMLPIHAKDVVDVLVRTQRCNQSGRPARLNSDKARTEDRWHDDGDQGTGSQLHSNYVL